MVPVAGPSVAAAAAPVAATPGVVEAVGVAVGAPADVGVATTAAVILGAAWIVAAGDDDDDDAAAEATAAA